MRIIAITDIHGQSEGAARLADVQSTADLLLIGGDVTHFGREDAASDVIARFRPSKGRILAVTGNCDYVEVAQYLTAEGLNIERRSSQVGGINFVGIGGSLPCPGKTPNEYAESELADHLRQAAGELDAGVQIGLVAHQPPLDTKMDQVGDGSHVGSQSVRSFIQQFQPLFCLTGHIHEARGQDSIGDTHIVNPGPFKDGFFAVIDIDGDNVAIQLNRL